jgi:1,5-anhydro-D-fructose reductase (1,5-anhydro-D-mannitol-forming)
VTGFEILGEHGSLVARDVMTVQPIGSVTLRDADGERPVELAQENLYARGVALFGSALRGHGSPAASGDDGVRSLAAALAVAESARTGQRVPIAA